MRTPPLSFNTGRELLDLDAYSDPLSGLYKSDEGDVAQPAPLTCQG
jgi:hypothetical protein